MTNGDALARPLRRLFVGHGMLAAATVALIARDGVPDAAWAGWDTALAIGAALWVQLGLHGAAQVPIPGAPPKSADYPARLAAALWSGEVGVRIAVVLLQDGQLPIAEARVLRIVLAGAACMSFAWSMTRRERAAGVMGRGALWAGVKWAFALQLATVIGVEIAALISGRGVAERVAEWPRELVLYGGWTMFALPYAVQWFTLHREVRARAGR